MAVSPIEALAGLLLIFFLPGFAVARALFPEWRFRGPDGLLRVVETGAMSLVLSVSLTVLIGFALLNSPGGFSASWSDPVLEAILAGITGVGLVAAGLRGAFAREAPESRPLELLGGEEGGAEALERAEELAREERRLRHALRVSREGPDAVRFRGELVRVRAEAERLGRAREEEYAR